MVQSEMILEFDRIKQMLCENAMSEEARQELTGLAPFLSERECRRRMQETTEARRILDSMGQPPLASIHEIGEVLRLCEQGAMLSPAQLEAVATFIASSKRMQSYLKKAEFLQVNLAYYGQSICDLTLLREEIEAVVQRGALLDSASSLLRDLRRRMENEGAQIKRKLDDLLRSRKNIFSDSYVSMRSGRYVLPVKKEFKNQVSGAVVDTSGTGGTYFIEPTVVAKLQEAIHLLQIEEENEIRRLLYTLTASVDGFADELRLNIEAMVKLDVAFAKARLSAQMKAIPVTVDTGHTMEIRQGRHPLLRPDGCVPLDFSIGAGMTGLVITGPNTGGKTVALKTVGLLSMMAQSGLHLPVESGRLCMRNQILCDIGDGQSITENLSTFSAHITNVIRILRLADRDSLVLLDELGSGTDPAEGMGIAVAILEELRTKGCLFLATTHYPEVKEYASQAQGLTNARMAFDRESLQPLYRLEIGEAGESCALYIAQRLGFPGHMLERARRAAYRTGENPGTPAAPPCFAADDKPPQPIAAPRIRPQRPEKARESMGGAFALGDSVVVSPEGVLGIVFQPADEKGTLGVQVQGVKQLVNYKRLTLKTPASELYPPDYDFSILFDPVSTRKARHKMGKRHIPGLEIPL